MEICVDRFTPCLQDAKTGELLPTVYTVVEKSELSSLAGWRFDWMHPDLSGSELYKLTLEGSDEIQGLVALTYFERDHAVYVNLAESAPHNLGKDKHYFGVGGHLFAIAAQKSIDMGYGGFLFLDAKNSELVEYYSEQLGAVLLGRPHPFRMIIDEDAARRLLNIYTMKEGIKNV